MAKRVLLDANLLIAAYDEDGTTSDQQRQQARKTIRALLTDDTVEELVITPLIRYEVLRGVAWQQNRRYQQVQQHLTKFTELDIKRQVSELAANLYRYDEYKAKLANESRNLEKRKFDVFHFATAHYYGLTLASQDSDIAKLQVLHAEYTQAIGQNSG
jgi:predicted nucleic acid-binding protein